MGPRYPAWPTSYRAAAVAVLAGAGLLGGCGTALPPVASTNRPVPGEPGQPGRPDQVLTPGQERASLAALRSVAEGERAVNPPGPAPGGLRWSDVPAAVSAACDDPGVEMVIVQTIATPPEDPQRYRFVLRTIEDWPGELVIRRARGQPVYEIESVSVGRFPSDPARRERARALAQAFEKHLEAFGRKAWFNDGATN